MRRGVGRTLSLRLLGQHGRVGVPPARGRVRVSVSVAVSVGMGMGGGWRLDVGVRVVIVVRVRGVWEDVLDAGVSAEQEQVG